MSVNHRNQGVVRGRSGGGGEYLNIDEVATYVHRISPGEMVVYGQAVVRLVKKYFDNLPEPIVDSDSKATKSPKNTNAHNGNNTIESSNHAPEGLNETIAMLGLTEVVLEALDSNGK